MFRERGMEGERERETSLCERNINQLPLTHTATGDQAPTLAYTLTGNLSTFCFVERCSDTQPTDLCWVQSFLFIFLIRKGWHTLG